MRPEPNKLADKFRQIHPSLGESPRGSNFGYFEIPPDAGGGVMRIISSGSAASVGEWEHVSVSHQSRCPTWGEMCRVKAMFFMDSETVQQFHVASSDHINVHNFCLHLWRQHGASIPMPPKDCV